MKLSYNKVEVSGPLPGCYAPAQQTTCPAESESIWLFAVQPGCLRRFFAVSLLFGVCSAGYIAAECYADFSAISSAIEDQESIVVTGNVGQQRNAVLANFARYNTRLEHTQSTR